MTFKEDLLSKGYLPENTPPCFQTGDIGQNLAARTGFLSNSRHPVRGSFFSASKRGLSRRAFSFIHPSTAHDFAQFLNSRRNDFDQFFTTSPFSLSRPQYTPDGERAVEISSHSEVESEKLARLSRFRFIARTDISRFYHSIYTHTLPWAMHGKIAAKADRLPSSAAIFLNRLDLITRTGQDGQTIGIPVGPDASRYLAETVATAIDVEFINRGGHERCEVLRHVDDVWIGADTHADAERALWKYREAIRSFELDINDTKTGIYSDNFTFSDVWPSEIAAKIEFANNSPDRRVPERLRAAFEYAFSITARNNDDGVLKYTLRFIDRNNLASSQWSVVEPFLKRAAAHYGHTIDYVSRIIVWRHLAHQDLNLAEWGPLIVAMLERHGRLGNDGEVCWALYAAIRLDLQIPEPTAHLIIQNCGPMSMLSVLSCIDRRLTARSSFSVARQILANETGGGAYWPVFLEWNSRRWSNFRQVQIENDLVDSLALSGVTIFDADRLPTVFQDVDEDDFSGVTRAIEQRPSQYDDEEGDESQDDGVILPF